MKKIALAVLAWLALAGAAHAQSSPGLRTGQVPTAAQWNSYFQAKQDVLNFIPVNKAGDTMLGRLQMATPSATRSGFSIAPGSVPSSPIDGDVWITSGGMFVRVSGVTYQVATGGATVNASTANNIAFYSGSTAISGNPNFTISGSALTAGIAGTSVGNWCLANATSGSICMAPTTGALGTVTATFPANSGTVAELNLAQAWTAAQTVNATFTMGQQMVASGRTDSTISADQNDWTPSGTGTYSQSATVYVDGGAADRNITGLTGGAAGRLINIYNKGTTNSIVLKNGSGSSSAANRFGFPADVTLPAKSGMVLYYDGTASLWKAFGQIASSVITSVSGSGLVTGGGSSGAVTVTVTAATKSDQQTGTSTTTAVTPAQAQSHDAAAKGWIYVTQSGGTYTVQANYNMTFSKTGTGLGTLTFNVTAFASANYALICAGNTLGVIASVAITNSSTASLDLRNDGGTNLDANFSCQAFGRQ